MLHEVSLIPLGKVGTRKGNQWYFGMKVHADVDAGSGYVHTVTGTAANANVHGVIRTHALMCDGDMGYGDSGHFGVEKGEGIREDEHLSQAEFRISRRPSRIKSIGSPEPWTNS